jgi:hypothetical protein
VSVVSVWVKDVRHFNHWRTYAAGIDVPLIRGVQSESWDGGENSGKGGIGRCAFFVPVFSAARKNISDVSTVRK